MLRTITQESLSISSGGAPRGERTSTSLPATEWLAVLVMIALILISPLIFDFALRLGWAS